MIATGVDPVEPLPQTRRKVPEKRPQIVTWEDHEKSVEEHRFYWMQ